MILKDIKVGEEYGAVDYPSRSRRRQALPRHVKVMEIVTVPVRRYRQWGPSTTVQVKQIKVKLLDAPLGKYGAVLHTGKENATTVIETRQIVAPWEVIKVEVTARLKAARDRQAKMDAMEKRVKKLVGSKEHFSVEFDGDEIRIEGKALEAMLTLAEKGKAAK